MRRVSQRYADELRIATPSVEREVRYLSGGNQQKVLLAKWLARRPRILIVDEPTRGVDVGSKAESTASCANGRQGMALLVVSSDLPEVLALAHRIVVMSEAGWQANWMPRRQPRSPSSSSPLPRAGHEVEQSSA